MYVLKDQSLPLKASQWLFFPLLPLWEVLIFEREVFQSFLLFLHHCSLAQLCPCLQLICIISTCQLVTIPSFMFPAPSSPLPSCPWVLKAGPVMPCRVTGGWGPQEICFSVGLKVSLKGLHACNVIAQMSVTMRMTPKNMKIFVPSYCSVFKLPIMLLGE